MGFIQHGDVILRRIDESEIPEDAKPVTGKKVGVIAEGEMTGHAHRLASLMAGQVLQDNAGNLFVKATEDTAVNHEEHNTLPIKVGCCAVDQVNEHDPINDVTRKVAD